MAWDPLRTSAGFEEYSGDTPMDAFGGALGKIADACTAQLGP